METQTEATRKQTSKETLDSRLAAMNLALTNATTVPDIQTSLEIFGYDDDAINEGKRLYENAFQAKLEQEKEYGEQYEATEELSRLRSDAERIYMVHLKVTRIAVKEKGKLDSLNANGIRKQHLAGWLQDAKSFYSNALTNPSILGALDRFNIDAAKLTEGQARITLVEEAYQRQVVEKGEAQTATDQRDQALDRLQDWYSDFIAIARIALEDQPQALEKLGIVVKN